MGSSSIWAPYLFSQADGAADAFVAGASSGSLEGETGLAEFERLFRAHGDGPLGWWASSSDRSAARPI
jgi:hypothetical protein